MTTNEMKKVIIDCDAGLDDASALMMAAKAHKAGSIKLMAITAVHGNTSLENVVKNVARTLTAAGVNEIPIFRGTYSSLVEPVINEEPFHGIDGFGDCNHDEEPDLRHVKNGEHATNALIRLVKEYPGEITLIALGPLTNLAMAIRLDEQFASNLKELYIMGGNREGVGNITTSAEFNFHCDPEAAYVLLKNTRCPTYIASWELSLKTEIDWDWRINVYGGVDSPQSRLMNKIEEKVTIDKHFSTYIVCDQLAVAAAIDSRSVAQHSAHYTTVELAGKYARGQMIVDHIGFLKQKPNVFLIDSMDLDVFKNMMLWSVDHPTVEYCPPMP